MSRFTIIEGREIMLFQPRTGYIFYTFLAALFVGLFVINLYTGDYARAGFSLLVMVLDLFLANNYRKAMTNE